MSPHGIPSDLIDRLVIVRTRSYSIQDIMQIVSIRAKTEGIQVEDEALAYLSQIGSATSLRYAVQLLTPSSILASANGRDTITTQDIDEASKLFFDTKASAKQLQEHAAGYINQ